MVIARNNVQMSDGLVAYSNELGIGLMPVTLNPSPQDLYFHIKVKILNYKPYFPKP
jgi:hypothetical protein